MAKSNNNMVEILYVQGSSLDRKGRRVLVRDSGCENYIWSVDEVKDSALMKLLGITDSHKKWIKQFLSSKRGE